MHLAAAGDRAEIVALLLRRGAEPNPRDHAEATPLLRACDQRAPRAARELLRGGATAGATARDKRGMTPLAAALASFAPAVDEDEAAAKAAAAAAKKRAAERAAKQSKAAPATAAAPDGASNADDEDETATLMFELARDMLERHGADANDAAANGFVRRAQPQ